MDTVFAWRIWIFALAGWVVIGELSAGVPADFPSGQARGAFARAGEKDLLLTYAGAFVDQKDIDKPIILILSDKKVPTQTWTSEFDLMMATSKIHFSGVLFWIDKEGKVLRCDDYWKGQHESTSGVYELKLEAKGPKELSGTASLQGGDGAKGKLEVMFRTALK